MVYTGWPCASDHPLAWWPSRHSGDFVTKVKQINSQSDLIWMTSSAGPSYLAIRSNLDDEFCQPVLHRNQILCLHHFNLRSLYFQSLQSLPNWIQLHTSRTSATCTPLQWINNKNTFFCHSLLIGQFQLKLFYCGNGRQSFASNVTLYPCECSRQNHLESSRPNQPRG